MGDQSTRERMNTLQWTVCVCWLVLCFYSSPIAANDDYQVSKYNVLIEMSNGCDLQVSEDISFQYQIGAFSKVIVVIPLSFYLIPVSVISTI